MKKFMFVLVALFSNFAFADYYRVTVPNCDAEQMRAALDSAAGESGAVITIVECEDATEETTTTTVATQRYANTWDAPYAHGYRPCAYQPKPVSAVVRREYFVRETVQEYKPVIKYVPAGTYVRVRPACNECGM